MGNNYRPGDYYMICDVCGFKKRRSQIRKRWDGAMVCRDDWEPKHPQEFARAIKDKQRVPIARPEPADVFIETLITQDDL